jgi:hypothetical protein
MSSMITSLTPLPRTTLRRDIAILCAAALVLLLPFLNKPLHLDDPMYVWAARQIRAHPLDFYGFRINWEGQTVPMAEQMINPPLFPYYLAAVTHVLGWSEIGLHLAVLPLSLGVLIGVYFLSRHFVRFPLLPPVLLLVSPGFLVSATTLMCDVPMLCFWIWSLVLWIRGSTRSLICLPVSATLLGIAALTKYSGACSLPLLIAYAIMYARPARTRFVQYASLLIPVVMVLTYNHFTAARYGRPLFWDAVGFASAVTGISASSQAKLLDGVMFIGGCSLVAAVLAFLACSARLQVIIAALVPFLMLLSKQLLSPRQPWASDWAFTLQAALMAAGGITILLIGVVDLARSPGASRPKSLLLLLWIAGVYVFAAKLNWAINARSILPMLPPVCILAQRALERCTLLHFRPLVLAGCTAALIAVLVSVADYRTALGNRVAADLVFQKFPHRRIWFTGHWGFEYYMLKNGGIAVEDLENRCRRNDILVVAMNNYGIAPPTVYFMPLDKMTADDSPFLTTQNAQLGAGFYFSPGDRLPYRFGDIHPDTFMILQVMEDARPREIRRTKSE